MIFFARGVLETVKKLRWSPDIVHCHGWFTSLIPLYLKRAFAEDPLFQDSKIVFSLYEKAFDNQLDNQFKNKLTLAGVTPEDTAMLDKPGFVNVNKMAIAQSDAIILASENIETELVEYAKSLGKPILPHQSEENYIKEYNKFYETILNS
jgi:starch synthase